jgi:hypothetical protein
MYDNFTTGELIDRYDSLVDRTSMSERDARSAATSLRSLSDAMKRAGPGKSAVLLSVPLPRMSPKLPECT